MAQAVDAAGVMARTEDEQVGGLDADAEPVRNAASGAYPIRLTLTVAPTL